MEVDASASTKVPRSARDGGRRFSVDVSVEAKASTSIPSPESRVPSPESRVPNERQRMIRYPVSGTVATHVCDVRVVPFISHTHTSPFTAFRQRRSAFVSPL